MSMTDKTDRDTAKLTDVNSNNEIAPTAVTKRGTAFWMVFASSAVVDLLSALDLTAVSTALPTIVNDLHGTDFIWAIGSYAIASTAVLPTVGGLVSIFGRKPILLMFIIFFALGSALSGGARNMTMLIAGRAIQGFGGGGCNATTEIIIADLVPLPERGKFLSIVAVVWAFACAIGPPIGGVLANSGSWRWLFFLNLPLCGTTFVLCSIFLRIHTPRESLREKFRRMDWLGNTLVILSLVSIMIPLTWAGVQFSWSSFRVLVPLCIGFVGLIGFFIIEAWIVKEPIVPWVAVKNRTTLSGYLGTFFHGITVICLIFYLPVYFQASKLASPTRSSVDLLGTAFSIPLTAIATAISVQIFKAYRPQHYVGWSLMMIGFGILSTLTEDSSPAKYVGYQILLGLGIGNIWVAVQFAILAPLPYSNNAHALAFFTFVRSFAQAWGTVIGGTILQNALKTRLPVSFTSTLPQRQIAFAYAIIPEIPHLQEPLRLEVQKAFAESTVLIWRVMIGVCGAGLISCFIMKEIPLRTSMDDKWGLEPKSVDSNIPLSSEETREVNV